MSQFGREWFKFPKDRTPEEHPDVFNGCKKFEHKILLFIIDFAY